MPRRAETGDRATVLLVHRDPAVLAAARLGFQRLLKKHGGNLSAARLELSTPERLLADNRALLAAVDALGLREWLVEHSADPRTGRPKKAERGT